MTDRIARRRLLALGSAALLAGCAEQPTLERTVDLDAGRRWTGGQVPRYGGETAPAAATPLRLGLLTPLTGRFGPYGRNLANAAMLALFDIDRPPGLELRPQDTGGTARGGANAAVAALADGAVALIGPATAPGARAAATVANSYRAPIMALTADRSIAAPGVYPSKRAPEAGAARIVDYAYRQGVRRLVAVAPDNASGRGAVRGMQGAALARRMDILGVAQLPPDAASAAKQSALQQAIAAAGPDGAVFLPYPARELTSLLAAVAPNDPPFLLGLEDWDGARLADTPGFARAVFAGVDPIPAARFRRRFDAAFGEPPVRDAALVYDLTAMFGQIAAEGGPVDPARGSGYQGVEGPFRPTRDGIVLRGYAVIGLRDGRPAVLEPAPQSLGL